MLFSIEKRKRINDKNKQISICLCRICSFDNKFLVTSCFGWQYVFPLIPVDFL